MALEGRPWGITGTLTNAGGRLLQFVGFRPQTWPYFQSPIQERSWSQFGWWDGMLWFNLGIVAGVVLSGMDAGDLALRRIRSWRKVALALGGGLLMGYGARISLGCTAGNLLGGIPSFSLQGWIFGAATFLGVLAGIRLFRRVL
jgi:hypothetical protein